MRACCRIRICGMCWRRSSNFFISANPAKSRKKILEPVAKAGSGQGKGEPLVKITPGVLDEVSLGFLHPLPDGGELHPAVFKPPKCHIEQQMSYKPTVIAAMVALALKAKKVRSALH